MPADLALSVVMYLYLRRIIQLPLRESITKVKAIAEGQLQAQQSSVDAEELAATAEELSQQATQLQQLISFFQAGGARLPNRLTPAR